MRFYLLIFFPALLHSVSTAARVTISLYAIRRKASPFEAGAVMALVDLLPMLFSVGTGLRIDRIGPRSPVRSGAAMVAPVYWAVALILASGGKFAYKRPRS